MKIKIRHIAPVILIVFIVGIAGTMGLNMWNTTGIKEPARYASGEFKGQYDPSDIRGSFTFEEINESFQVPVEDLARAFGFDDVISPGLLKAKDIEGTYGAIEGGELGTDSVRMFVAYYLGLPFTSTEDTLLPKSAISILKAKGKITEEQAKNLEGISVDIAAFKPSATAASSPVEKAHEEITKEPLAIKGKTTFKELLDYGITKEEIEEILGMPMARSGETIRDYVGSKGMEFSVFKDKIQALVNAKQ